MTKAALLVIDFINDIVDPNGKIAASASYIAEHQVIEKANEAMAFARNNNIPVILVKVGFTAGYLECPEHSPVFGKAKQYKALQLGTWGTEFHEKLKIEPQDLIIIKHRISAFYATALEAILRANQIDTLLLSGVSTHMAIASTAREAHDRDYQVVIIGDACGTANQALQDTTLEILGKVSKIIKTSELKALFDHST
jgi:nicotinamidase-related amidase